MIHSTIHSPNIVMTSEHAHISQSRVVGFPYNYGDETLGNAMKNQIELYFYCNSPNVHQVANIFFRFRK